MEVVLEQDIIKLSNSPWNFPMFLVPKKGGTSRPAVDYRQLNKKCHQERYPLPVLNDRLMPIGPQNMVFFTQTGY